MDITVLPNNNHPEKFLQLDVGTLPSTHSMFHVGALMSSQRHWKNRVYSQREGRGESKSRSPPSPEGISNIKRNPLFVNTRSPESVKNSKSGPSWTIKEYDIQAMHGNLADYLQEEEKTPKDLDFWLEDLYTPGFDSLLKKKEAEQQRKSLCKFFSLFILFICVVVIVITVLVLVLQQKN